MRDPVSLARVSTPALCAPPPWSSCFGHVRLRGEGSPPRHTQPCRVELVVAGSLVVVVIIVVVVLVVVVVRILLSLCLSDPSPLAPFLEWQGQDLAAKSRGGDERCGGDGEAGILPGQVLT